MSLFHQPVLLQSACTWLAVQPGEHYVDATIGGGGHTAEILRRGGLVLGLDQDKEALDYLKSSSSIKPALSSKKLILVNTNFIHLEEVVTSYSWFPVSGVLFDLGVSWHQLDTPRRGFSFQTPGPLDMRLDPSSTHTAADLVNTLPTRSLTAILLDYGNIPSALSLAAKIIAGRPFTTTDQLAKVAGRWSRQAFQALRIAVNDELTALQTTLPQALRVLAAGGRIIVISFHSLEDRLVKRQFQAWARSGQGHSPTPRPVVPSSSEIAANPKSHSAKLRVFAKKLEKNENY